MPNWLSYKGIDVPNATPADDAGLKLKNDLEALADRVGPCNFTATTNPTATDDASRGYEIGSFWVNTLTDTWFVCTNNATGAAVWNTMVVTDTAANLASIVLAQGQIGYATDTHTMAMGNGATSFASLAGATFAEQPFEGDTVTAFPGIVVVTSESFPLTNSASISDLLSYIELFPNGSGFVVGLNTVMPTVLDSHNIYTDGHGDIVIWSDGTQDAPALKVKGSGAYPSSVNISDLPVGTLASPPAGINIGDLWLDTTGGGTANPIVRCRVS